MEHVAVHQLIVALDEKTGKITSRQKGKWNIGLTKRIIKKLGLYAEDCKLCSEYLFMLKKSVENIGNKTTEEKEMIKHQILLNTIMKHLKNEHKLVSRGSFISMFLLFGCLLSILLGLIGSDQIEIWMLTGVVIGLVAGIVMERNAWKKNQLI